MDSVQFFLEATHFSGQYHNDQLAVQQRNQQRLEKAQSKRRNSCPPSDRANNQGQPLQRRRSFPSFQQPNFQGQTPLSEENVAIGNIVFLQPKNDDWASIKCIQPDCKNCTIDDAAFNHPAVILRMWNEPTKGEIMALCCTISGNHRPSGHTRSLPISRVPKNNAPKGSLTYHANEIMYLEKAGTMIKQSYILNDHVYAIPLSKMRPFNVHQPFGNRLSQESYIDLMQSVNFPAGNWIQTSNLENGDIDPATKATKVPADLASNSTTLTTSTKKAKKSKSKASGTISSESKLGDLLSEVEIDDI